ncbi:MAG: Gfo/Idh/MocA family protein [Candidatus Dormibacteraceae bacterium]
MTLGWGIIGLGRSADTLMAPAITADPESRLAAVVSRSQEKADAFAAKHGAAAAGTDYDQMLANPEVDVVLITTPNLFHPEQAIRAAREGKHVLCDKPLAPDAAQAESVLAACQAAGVSLGTNFQTRYHTCFDEARRVIEGGEIGEVLTVQVDASSGAGGWTSWRADPELSILGAINNVAVHMYDLLRFLIGGDVTELTALLDVERRQELERIPLVLMRFENGAMAFANGNQGTPRPLNDIVIHGSEGRIDGRGITRPFAEGEMRVVTAAGERSRRYSSGDCYERIVAAFSGAVLSGREPSPSGLDGLRCVQITDAIVRSAREGRLVTVGR